MTQPPMGTPIHWPQLHHTAFFHLAPAPSGPDILPGHHWTPVPLTVSIRGNTLPDHDPHGRGDAPSSVHRHPSPSGWHSRIGFRSSLLSLSAYIYACTLSKLTGNAKEEKPPPSDQRVRSGAVCNESKVTLRFPVDGTQQRTGC